MVKNISSIISHMHMYRRFLFLLSILQSKKPNVLIHWLVLYCMGNISAI